VDTALREFEEETGIGRHSVRLREDLGTFDSSYPKTKQGAPTSPPSPSCRVAMTCP
jgi:8-oxo-dGTP pyrophosphatase MutT (NUDIX family)